MPNQKLARLVLSFFTTVLIAFATSSLYAQSSVSFPPAVQTAYPGSFGLEENVGLSGVTSGNGLFVWFRGDSTDPYGRTYLCGVQYFPTSSMTCPQDQIPVTDAPPQITVWKNQIWMAYAYSGTHQLVVCHGYYGYESGCSLIPNTYVADSPAIAATPDGTELDIAYQQNASSHYLGIAYTTDGLSFSNVLSSRYQIGHTPAMAAFNGKLIIAAFCQCNAMHTIWTPIPALDMAN